MFWIIVLKKSCIVKDNNGGIVYIIKGNKLVIFLIGREYRLRICFESLKWIGIYGSYRENF